MLTSTMLIFKMYLHLGFNNVIKSKTIVGIFDFERTTVSKYTREFLKKAEKNKEVVNIGEDLPKSFTLTNEKGNKVYISPISSVTLKNRKLF